MYTTYNINNYFEQYNPTLNISIYRDFNKLIYNKYVTCSALNTRLIFQFYILQELGQYNKYILNNLHTTWIHSSLLDVRSSKWIYYVNSNT